MLERANHPSLPGVVDSFADNGTEYLVEQFPIGNSLWDAWDEADDAATRYGWARQIAEALQALHKAGAILEGVRPDVVVITDAGTAVLSDVGDMLPVPVPPSPPLRATLYTAPELILAPQTADARADLYSFGAMLYSLEYLHHALEEKDFERQFAPRQITDRYPDVHPLFLRLVNKTFVRDVNTRFPTDEAGKVDPTGFTELIRTLEQCRRSFDQVRLDIAAWTTTGMVRTGNEDAFCVLHGVEQRQDDLTEYAMVLLVRRHGRLRSGRGGRGDRASAKMREFLLAAADVRGAGRQGAARRIRSTPRRYRTCWPPRCGTPTRRCTPRRARPARAAAAWAAPPRPSTSTRATSSSATSATAGPITCAAAG